MSSKPNIHVRAVQPADADELVRIHQDAFSQAIPSRINYPHGLPDVIKNRLRSSYLARPDEIPGREARFVIAEISQSTDKDKDAGDNSSAPPPQIAAYVKYIIYHPGDGAKQEKPRDISHAALGPQANLTFFRDFKVGLDDMRVQAMAGQPGIYLAVLATNHRFHRLGAGTVLLRHVSQQADALGLPVFLESSPIGYPLYRRNGYVPLDKLDVEVAETYGVVRREGDNWGEASGSETLGPLPTGFFRLVLMKRMPGAEGTVE